jgi:cytochrome c peroxidase
LDCHRYPEKYVRPREFVFTMGYQPSEDQETLGRKLVMEYKIQDQRTLTSCNTCHR